jgi:hypothetical protein
MPQFENILPSSSDTLLSISSMGHMIFQARGLSQTLEVIGEASQMERTINGTLIDISAPQFRKYHSKISVPSEVYPTPIDGVFPGQQVVVHCAVSLAYITGTPGFPKRTQVSGSSWTENGYTFYRPLLTMLIKTVETHFDEWKNIVGWTIDLEEV